MQIYQDAERFINDQFWANTHDKRSTLNIPEIVAAKLKADNEQKDPTYFNHREGVVHVSYLTKCLRGVINEMLGGQRDTPIDTRKLGVFKAGNLFEDFIIDALGDRVVHKQREYSYKYKGITLVGRSDYTIDDNGIMRIGENKSVHSNAFWYREKEGTLVSWQNQVQLQTYMWLERILNGNEWEGVFSYVSKDDVTVVGAPVKFNQAIIDEVVIPALDIIAEAYAKKDPSLAPVPPLVIFNNIKSQYETNWLCKFCEFHNQCAGVSWTTEAETEVKRLNASHKNSMHSFVASAKPKPTISVEKVD